MRSSVDEAGGNVSGEPGWLEVNIISGRDNEDLLCGLVADLVDSQRELLDRWFYFWEPDLRLRMHWPTEETAVRGREAVAVQLDAAVSQGEIQRWAAGAHGQAGEQYLGEADQYGAKLWPLISLDWTHASDLALNIIRAQKAGGLEPDRDFHWSRRVHLFSNQLGHDIVSEADACLRQALGYLSVVAEQEPAVQEVCAALHKYLHPPRDLGNGRTQVVAMARPDGGLTTTFQVPEDVEVTIWAEDSGVIVRAETSTLGADTRVLDGDLEILFDGTVRAKVSLRSGN